jgi:CHAT domain-containing protein/Tfp pilus assembly protein PilF
MKISWFNPGKCWFLLGSGLVLLGLGIVDLPPFSSRSAAIAHPVADTTQEDEAFRHFQAGNRLLEVGDYRGALAFFEQAIALIREVGAPRAEAAILNSMGVAYRSLGDYARAAGVYEQSLRLVRTRLQDREAEGTVLNNLGQVYDNLGQYERALDIYRQALALALEVGDRTGEALALNNIGATYDALGQDDQALERYREALALHRELGNRADAAIVMNNIGALYRGQGQYAVALDYYQQALEIHQELGFRAREAGGLQNLAQVYSYLGQHQQAVEVFQQALAISRELGDRPSEAVILNNLGLAYDALEQDQEALAAYQESLAIRQAIGDRPGEGAVLNNIGAAFAEQGNPQRALEYYQQALALRRSLGNRPEEGVALSNIARAYGDLGRTNEALQVYQEALAILAEVGDRPGEVATLGNVGRLLTQLEQPELAILFYKRAVNLTETIRQDLFTLSPELQQSYLDTVTYIYRELADLLLQQDRVLEGQQVLDLLKVQELRTYLQEPISGSEAPDQHLDYWPAETELLTLYTGTGQEFDRWITSPAVREQVSQLQRNARGQALNPDVLVSLQDNLQQAGTPTALLYPLILGDRLELVLVLPDAPLIRRPVPVAQADLEQVIEEFRLTLTTATGAANRVLEPAQQLYQWLIQPIAADLQRENIQTILYAADGQLRYIPLAALHDGQFWLIQNYSINHITAASLTNFGASSRTPLRVLAMAFSDPQRSYQVNVGGQRFSLAGLQFAGQEVAAIADEIPDTTTLFNQEFSRTALESQMNDYLIVHLATHAEFVPGRPEESFILLGNGDRITLRDIASWNIPNVELVVLSACRTAVSGELGNGEEILGFGYQVQRARAQAAIASLWYVNDESSQQLMIAFYAALAQGMTDAEALRQAQIDLITGNVAGGNVASLSRPYYWAPFILIGNGL